jgi:hypothetical protein
VFFYVLSLITSCNSIIRAHGCLVSRVWRLIGVAILIEVASAASFVGNVVCLGMHNVLNYFIPRFTSMISLDISSCDVVHGQVDGTPTPAIKYIEFEFAAGKKDIVYCCKFECLYGLNPVLNLCTVPCPYGECCTTSHMCRAGHTAETRHAVSVQSIS